MLDSVKIDGDSCTRAVVAAKRMRRREAELLSATAEDPAVARMRALDHEIAMVEGGLAVAAFRDEASRARQNRFVGTLRAVTTMTPPLSRNVFYRSTSRCQSERALAHLQVDRDSIGLEPAGPPEPLSNSVHIHVNGPPHTAATTTASGVALPAVANDTSFASKSAQRQGRLQQKQQHQQHMFGREEALGSLRRARHGSSPAPALSSPTLLLAASLADKSPQRILGHTSIVGEPISSCSDDDEDDHITSKKHSGDDLTTHSHTAMTSKGRAPPSVHQVDERPWEGRRVHPVLVKDPYLRKHKLHRFDTRLHSEHFKRHIMNAPSALSMVEADPYDFGYRGYLAGQGLRRGNLNANHSIQQ